MVPTKLLAVLLAHWLVACGKTDHDDHTSGDTMAGSTAGGAPAPVGAAGGSIPAPDFPLILGEGDCPEFAPTQSGCGDLPAKCIYPGLQVGPYAREGEVRCDCVDESWLCVVTEQRFRSDCPMVHWTKLQEAGATCPRDPAQSCTYWVAGSLWGAVCGCSSAPEAAGAGRAAGREWMCGL